MRTKGYRGTPTIFEDACTGLANSLRYALSLLAFPVSSGNAEKAFSIICVVNRKVHGAVTNASVAK